MEKNNPDFMKNNPVAGTANQIKDTMDTHGHNTPDVLSIVLTIVMFVFAIICFVKGNYPPIIIFVAVGAVLIVSSIYKAHKERVETLKGIEKKDSVETIFKDHEE